MLLFFFTSLQLSDFPLHSQNMSFARKNRSEEIGKAIRTTETVRPAEESGEDRAHGKNNERHGHGLRRFVNVVLDLVVHTRLAVKRKVNEAEHVKRRHQRSDIADAPQQVKGGTFACPRFP